MTISYIWRAEQTEPGMTGERYAATATEQAPCAIAPVQAHPGLVYAESRYSEWKMIGTANGPCYRNDYGDFIELDTPHCAGMPVEVEQVVRCGWYSRAAA